MTPSREDDLFGYIDHLKVLRAVALKNGDQAHHQIATWTEQVLLSEAEVATLDFRIREADSELKALGAKRMTVSKRRKK